MSSPVVTRFAPSPTGFLHIGGARTALFNWLYAQHNRGKMLLRIEDTDRERSSEAAIRAILDGLDWLGLAWEGDAISQYERVSRHRDIAKELVTKGKAYYCYATRQELDEMREKARADGRPPQYDGRWRERDPSEAPSGITPVIRIKAPQTGETIVYDEVQGTVRFPNKDLDDFIILRSDGNPTYMHAVVVDDHDMGVTHIIRGDDHLTNAARQMIIYDAMSWKVPSMSHIPLIHGPDGTKLSKRHGALGIEAYCTMGYLPSALRNYLARLGWSHGNDEIMSTNEMIEWFDVKDINKSAARFDLQKLEAINGHYMRASSDNTLLEKLIAILPKMEDKSEFLKSLDDKHRKQFLAAIPHLKERAKTLVELLDGAQFIFAERPLLLDEKATNLLNQGGRAILTNILPSLEAAMEWSAENLDSVVHAYTKEAGFKLGQIAQPLRAALTGRLTSPGIFDVLVILGKDEALARIRNQIS